MNKVEFLEILKDYLKKDFSENEINDILRDYEEYFLDGVIEGKSDMEIISGLGSPKSIANELISQVKNKNEKETKTTDKLNDKLNLFKIRTKEMFGNAKEYISDKLTPNIQNDNHNSSRKLIQIALTILSLILIIPSFVIIVTLIAIGISLFASLIVFLGTMPVIINFINKTQELTLIYLFASIAFVGGQILAWQIYLFIIKIVKKSIKNYTSWMKTRNLYINASKKKEEYDNKEDLSKDYIDFEDKEGDDQYE